MLQGCVRYQAPINHREFATITVPHPDPRLDRVELEAPHRGPLRIEVHFASVASAEDARAYALAVARDMVERLTFELGVAIGDPAHESEEFSPVPGSDTAAQPHALAHSLGMMIQGVEASLALNPADVARLQAQLQQPRSALPGERYYGVFQSAMRAENPVERFLSLYNIVLLRHNDDQKDVDAFIRNEEPGVPQTPSPKFPTRMETVYTRLRNEFAHIRQGTSFEQTRQEMEQRLGGLALLAKEAIQIP